MAGTLAQIRNLRDPNPREWILAYEANGDYTEALPYHQIAAIGQSATTSETHLGLITCLMRLNQPQLASHYMEGLLSESHRSLPEDMRRKLDEARAEAAWKLGSWDALESLLSHVSADRLFNSVR